MPFSRATMQLPRLIELWLVRHRDSALTTTRSASFGSPRNLTILHRHDLHSFCHGRCHNASAFDALLYTLPISAHFGYTVHPPNVCFHEAMLGTFSSEQAHSIVRSQTVAAHIAHRLLGPLAADELVQCERTVLVLDRERRRILNAEEVGAAARARGLFAHVVRFEGTTFDSQLRHMRCAQLVVSVHGAGQQLLVFMRPGATLLSIGWEGHTPDWFLLDALDAHLRFHRVITDQLMAPPANESIKWADVRLPMADAHAAVCSTFGDVCKPSDKPVPVCECPGLRSYRSPERGGRCIDSSHSFRCRTNVTACVLVGGEREVQAVEQHGRL